MQKLRLSLDQLEVESFKTAPDAATRSGTVFARATEFTGCTCDYNACTGAYYTCDAQCGTVQTADVEVTCNLQCGTGGGGGTADLACYSQAQGCTAVDGCHTVNETCYPCG